MKKMILLMVVAALVAAPLAAPATAGKKQTLKAKPAPVPPFFLHGTQPVGELDSVDNVTNAATMKMDSTEPTAAEPKSMFVTNLIVSPNDQCSGNSILPFWKGDFAGKFKGDVKVTLNTIATPAAEVSVELFVDPTGGCTSDLAGTKDFIEPVAEQIVAVAPGPGVTEVTFKKVKFKTVGTIGMQVHMAKLPENPSGEEAFVPAQVRILYDSTEFPSSVELIRK